MPTEVPVIRNGSDTNTHSVSGLESTMHSTSRRNALRTFGGLGPSSYSVAETAAPQATARTAAKRRQQR